MQKIFRSLLFTAIIFIAISSCKKYPDGPVLSLHSKEKRVVGEWSVDYYSINGYDSTAYLQSQPYYGKYIFDAEDKDGDNPPRFRFVRNNSLYSTTIGYWQFGNNKKNLTIEQSVIDTSLHQFGTNPYIAHYISWEIRRLTTKDLWLKTTYNAKEYFMKLKH